MSQLTDKPNKRLIIGISGASGAIYGVRLLEMLRNAPEIETHLVISRSAQLTLAQETDYRLPDVQALAHHTHSPMDISAGIASGSFAAFGMIVAPCSMKTLAEIAHSLSTTLLTRAADVMLKERRRLVLLTRETPLTAAHLRNMLAVTEMGGIIAPPVPAFYSRPDSLAAMVDHTLGRVLDLFDPALPGRIAPQLKRWEGMTPASGGN